MMQGEIMGPTAHERKRRRKFLWSALFGITIVAIILLFYFITIGSGIFRIDKLEIEARNEALKADVLAFLHSQIPGSGLFAHTAGFFNILVWPKEFSESALTPLPSLVRLNITKSLRTHTVKVEVEERQFYGMWCTQDSCFWFDESGFIFARGFRSEGKFIKTIEDTSHRPLGIGRKALGEKSLANLFSVFEVLDEAKVAAKRVQIEDPQAREVSVETYGGAILYFSLDFSSLYTASTLRTLAQKPGLSHLQYIDFRVENRAYYK